MRERYLWRVFLFLLAFLPLFFSFADGAGKFTSIEEVSPLLGAHYFTHARQGNFSHTDWQSSATLEQPPISSFFFGTLLSLHNIKLRDASLSDWQQEALAHNIPPSTFYNTLFKTISPNVLFNLRAFVFVLSCFNLFLLYLLFRHVFTPESAGFAVALLAWLPQFTFFSTRISNQPIIFFLLLLSLHFLLQWQSLLSSHQRLKSWCMTIICGALLGYSFGAQFSPLPLLILFGAVISLWYEYRQTLFSLHTLLLQSLLMLASCCVTAFLLTPVFWMGFFSALQSLWMHFTESMSIMRTINNDVLNPKVFSWIKLAQNFTDVPHFMPKTLIKQEFLALLMLFAATLFLLARGNKKEQHATSPLQSQKSVQTNTLFIAASVSCMLSMGSFLLSGQAHALYLFWPWLAIAAARGFIELVYALAEKRFLQIRKPFLYALFFCINVFVCSKSPWFATTQRDLAQASPAQQIAYLESMANRSSEPEAYWNRIALINLYERNRAQAKIFALKTLSRKPFDPTARFIVQHLHEKELKM